MRPMRAWASTSEPAAPPLHCERSSMKARYLVTAVLSAALAGCSGGGSGGGSGAPVAPIAAPPLAQQSAILPISFTIPNRTVSASSSQRAPRYVSPGTASVAVYDGATLIYVGNYSHAAQCTAVYGRAGTASVTSGTCVAGTSSQTCTLTITTTIGAHAFDVITYPVSQGQSQATARERSPSDVGTIPTFTGVI